MNNNPAYVTTKTDNIAYLHDAFVTNTSDIRDKNLDEKIQENSMSLFNNYKSVSYREAVTYENCRHYPNPVIIGSARFYLANLKAKLSE